MAFRLHTICGRNAAAIEKAREQHGWDHAATDWREVVANPEIDVIDINTPNDSHAEIAIAAARAGKHICEKPLAMNVKECRQMLQAVKKAKVTHMICHNYRRIPAIAQAKKMIDEGALGQIRHYHARYAQSWLVDPKAPTLAHAETICRQRGAWRYQRSHHRPPVIWWVNSMKLPVKCTPSSSSARCRIIPRKWDALLSMMPHSVSADSRTARWPTSRRPATRPAERIVSTSRSTAPTDHSNSISRI